jgi:hypothetical protein
VTVKTIKKKQKHRSRGSVRTVTKTVQNDSFFNFFSPPPSKYFHGRCFDALSSVTIVIRLWAGQLGFNSWQ